jgi:hypothetical protein
MTKDQSAISMLEGLLKGSITITTVEDYNAILTEYPDNPFVNRLVADFLKKGTSFSNAIKKYKKTYKLFMADGETLHAIAALIELWEIVKPAPYDFRSLHSQLRRRNSHNSLLDECFATMSYQELRAILSHLEKTRVKAKEIVQYPGNPEESLYFVISGKLVKSPAESESENHDVVQFLIANDHFGDDHPCEIKEPAPYQIRAASESELLKISKDDFLTICRDHPNLKNGLQKLLKDQLIPEGIKPEKFFRKTSRHHQKIYLSLDIFYSEPGRQPISVKGFSSDISLGGACVIIDPKYQDISIDNILNRKTLLRVSLPDESISVLIFGNIVWSKKTEIDGQQASTIGVEFNDTPPRLRAAMLVFVNEIGSMTKHAATNYKLSQDEPRPGKFAVSPWKTADPQEK